MTFSNLVSKSAITLLCLLLAVNTSAQQYSKITYVHSEADGTAFAATDSQGNIEWQIDHYPYGGEYSNTEVARKNDISFAGKPYDEEIGLSYFGARWYDPDIGRFTGVDPMPVNPNDYRTFNRYSYAFNNPYKYQDPDGRLAFLIPVAIFLAKELAAEAASRATNGATDFLSVRRLGTKAVKAGAKAFKNSGNKLARTNGCCCFDAGTLVKTKEGFSPIEKINVGDWVHSYDQEIDATSLKPVTELFITDPKPLYNLVLKDNAGVEETFIVTDNHPYWVVDKGWVDSAQLELGMQVMSYDGNPLEVTSLVLSGETKPTYNFTVADTNTYYVGETEALVHNCNCSSGASKDVAGPFSKVKFEKPQTKRAGTPEIKTDVTREDAIQTLKDNGFSAKDFKAQNGGTGTVLTKGDKTITTFPTSTSTGGPTGKVKVNNQRKSSIRFGQSD